MPTEIHVMMVEGEKGERGILLTTTTEGIVEVMLDRDGADTIVYAVGTTGPSWILPSKKARRRTGQGGPRTSPVERISLD